MTDWLRHLPAGDDAEPDPDETYYCGCPVFVPQPIPLFNAVQCATCARPERPDT